MEDIRVMEKVMVISKKYYAGGEVVTEFITPENQVIDCHISITQKKGGNAFVLGDSYFISFARVDSSINPEA